MISLDRFVSLGLDEWLAERLVRNLAISAPTEVQSRAIPHILKGKDVVVQAPTGSGKTLAFVLPILQSLSRESFSVHAVILTPVRELAVQIATVFASLAPEYSVLTVTGGRSSTAQARLLAERPHVVVATPGRLGDLLEVESSDLVRSMRNTKFLVLDEADKLMNAGFEAPLATIIGTLPDRRSRQTLLFSATVTSSIEALRAAFGSEDMPLIECGTTQVSASVVHKYVFLPSAAKLTYLVELLDRLLVSRGADQQAIVFTSSIRSAQLLCSLFEKLLAARTQDAGHARHGSVGKQTRRDQKAASEEQSKPAGIHAVTLHSLLEDQNRRNAALGKFRNRKANVLITTDVAARGIDIPDVRYVVNFDLPREVDEYLHRAGRCGRAGRVGTCISIVVESEQELFDRVETRLGESATIEEVEDELQFNSGSPMEKAVLKRMTAVTKARHEAELLLEDIGFDQRLKERKKRRLN